jgi:hypothetical protein
MNMKAKSPTLLVASLFAVLAAGCASTEPTAGSQMIAQAQETKELGRQWQSGNRMVASGERVKAEGQDIIAQGDAKVKEGERLIAEGQKMMEEAELVFKTRFPGQSLDTYK